MNIYIIIAVIVAILIMVGLYFSFFGTKANLTEKALALAAMGNLIDAKAIIRDQLDLYPDDPKLLFTFSRLYSMENDFESEAAYLERIKSKRLYSKDFSEELVNTKLGNIYYKLDKSDQSFYSYIDALSVNPTNLEALMRLSFMAVGQKDFEIADLFMRQINDDDIRLSSYFVAKGVVQAMLNRDNDFEYFEKAYKLEPKSVVNIFLHSLSLSKIRKHQEAIKIASPLLEINSEDLVKFTLNQFMMTLYSSNSDYAEAQNFAKKAIEIARKNDWELELADSCSHFAMFCLVLNQLDLASEFLIEAESIRVDDYDIISLANYKSDLEDGQAQAGKTSLRGYNLKHSIKELPDKIFSKDRYFEISGLKSNEGINIRGMINQDGKKIISSFNQLSQDKVSKFNSLKGTQFKSICVKMLTELGYKVKRELPALEIEGANYLVTEKSDSSSLAIFRIRKWKKLNMSDVFLTELISSVTEHSAEKGFVIGDAELTQGAKKIIKANQGVIKVIFGKELESLLEKVLK
jgi:tetratricopeptide (TPR) repeat protein